MANSRWGVIWKLKNSVGTWRPEEQAGQTKAGVNRLNRRELLGAGTTVVVTGLAGCNQLCPQEFDAPPAVLPNPGSFGLQNSQPQRIEIKKDLMIAEDRVLINHYVVYEPVDGGAVPSVGILSTPPVSCVGQTLNPIVTQEFSQLLADSQSGEQFVSIVAPEATSTNWVKGPTPHDSWSGTLFDQPVSVEAFSGILGDSQDSLYAVVVAMARHTNQSEAVLVGSGTSKSLPPDVSPSGFKVVPSAFTRVEITEIKQLTLRVLPKIEKRSLSKLSPGSYGFGGYGQGGYGGVSP